MWVLVGHVTTYIPELDRINDNRYGWSSAAYAANCMMRDERQVMLGTQQGAARLLGGACTVDTGWHQQLNTAPTHTLVCCHPNITKLPSNVQVASGCNCTGFCASAPTYFSSGQHANHNPTTTGNSASGHGPCAATMKPSPIFPTGCAAQRRSGLRQGPSTGWL
jgi:hypothetical protein